MTNRRSRDSIWGSPKNEAIPAAPEDSATPIGNRRHYDSPDRRQRVAETQERIVAAGAELTRELSGSNRDDVTFRSVAVRAGVSERTVYRHFPSEFALRDAIAGRLELQAGVSYEGLSIDQVTALALRVFSSMPPCGSRGKREVTAPTSDRRRQDGILSAVTGTATGWSGREQRLVAAVLDVLCSMPTFERLTSKWRMDGLDVLAACEWAVGLVVDGIRNDRRPTNADEEPGAPRHEP